MLYDFLYIHYLVASQAVNIAAVSVRKIFFHKEIFCISYCKNNFSSSLHRHHSGQTKKFMIQNSECRIISLMFFHS